MSKGIDHLIICSAFAKPDSHWAYDRETQRFERKPGRRPASYTIATPGVDSYDDPVSPTPRSVCSIPGEIRSATSASSPAAPTS